MNTILLRSVFAALAACVALPFARAHAETSRPNIILVMPDDVGYVDYACLGNLVLRTPSVDAFK